MNYLVQCTRPDLAFAWSYLSQFLNNPSIMHRRQFLHLLRYLSRTKNLGITLGGPTSTAFFLKAFCNADHASSNDQRSSTGCSVFLNGPVIWRCTKQPVIALSTTKAEHRACSESGQDLLWASQLLSLLLAVLKQPTSLPSLFCDNQGAIALLENPVYQHRTRHIDVWLQWIQHHIAANDFSLHYFQSSENLADGMTKILPPLPHSNFLNSTGIKPLITG